ncbi:MAG: acetyltransferase [Gammaproteobacteria bacterium]|nr:acetyltransferase [Gammaproteobacteria bacterium]
MNRSLLIIGAGGHGRVVADAARLTGKWKKIAFIDDRYPELVSAGVWSVIGTVAELHNLSSEWGKAVIAVGDNATRIKILEKTKSCGFDIVSIIHPSTQIAEDVLIGEGTVIFANAVINTGSKLGTACIVNTAATVDHDNQIEDGVHISPGAHLGGNVVVGTRSWIGVGASVIHGCAIGYDVIVGAGAAVTDDIGDELIAVGVPARELMK